MVYSITLAPATNDDKNFLIASGIRETLVDDMVWVVVHCRQIGAMSWWEAYRLTVAVYPDTHMNAAQRQQLDPDNMADSRKPKAQRTLEF